MKANTVNGYEFPEWKDEVTDNQRTVTMNGNVDLSVTFTPVTYTITYGLGGGELGSKSTR